MAATAANPCVELAVIDGPSVSSSTGAGVFFKWLGWGALYLAAAIVVLVACAVLFKAVADKLSRARRRRAAAASRRRLRRKMMKTMWHAPYQRLLAAGFVRNPCVVCRTEYEAGENCSVLPGCVHVQGLHRQVAATAYYLPGLQCHGCPATTGCVKHGGGVDLSFCSKIIIIYIFRYFFF
jgi:hypothetical protein